MRVIGGSERGRRLQVPKGREVRPTPDRVRETLFNWLQGEVEGTAALDLFAGSGALGIEALSRGAAVATFAENARPALAALEANLASLTDSGRSEVVRVPVWRYLKQAPARSYHLVFLDPPYGRGWAARAAHRLETGGWLAPGAAIYVETGADESAPEVPATWGQRREGRCGEVAYRLFRNEAPTEETP
ncbi:MAG: 16S rRNA (guanine(966)-N(2))-methyltransferase RsmD [Thiohalorhabdus sp.]|uniref:16S rRNA (guanine(966)-N(2))-methyltransferase RsmD n=2 Tax=Thiohalorhabdus sp. TaxID=3094134 RepID=UPI002FC2DD92